MTQPRQIVLNRTYLVTRRVLRRHYLLAPDFFVNNLFVFFLAVLSAKYGIVFHAFCLASTHEHLVLSDIEGNLPKFLCEQHRITALVMKVYRKWEGPLQEPDKPSIVHLQTPEAVVQTIAYVMAKPTECWAVKNAADWPGLISSPHDLWKGTWTATKPTQYLDQESERWPARVTLRLQTPASKVQFSTYDRSHVIGDQRRFSVILGYVVYTFSNQRGCGHLTDFYGSKSIAGLFIACAANAPFTLGEDVKAVPGWSLFELP